jgi:hypothetical protein
MFSRQVRLAIFSEGDATTWEDYRLAAKMMGPNDSTFPNTLECGRRSVVGPALVCKSPNPTCAAVFFPTALAPAILSVLT